MKKYSRAYFPIVFALLLALVLTLTACAGGAKTAESSPDPTELPSATAEAPTAQPTAEPVPDGTHFLINMAFDKPGEIVLTQELVLKLLESSDLAAPQEVWIVACYFPGAADFAVDGKTYAEYRSDPALCGFEAEYRDWMLNTYLPQYAEKLELSQNGDGEATEWLSRTASDMFYDEWSARVSEETLSAYNEAYSNYRGAKKALRCEGDPAAARAALDEELARLKALGFDFELKAEPGEGLMAFDIFGELTLDKLFDLTADPDWAYCIYPWPADFIRG